MGRVLGAASRGSRLVVVLFIIVTGLHADPSSAQEPVRPAPGARPVAENVAGGEQPVTGDPRRPEADGLRATARTSASPAGVTDRSSLVNDPTVDGLNDTQVGSTLTLSGGNVVSAYFDSGSTAAGNQRAGYSVSTDGGTSFVDKGMLPASAAGAGASPVLATDTTTGRVYLATMTFSGRDQLQLFRSDDGGVSFRPPVNPTPGFVDPQYPPQLLDGLWMAVDNFPGGPAAGQGNVYITWQHWGGPEFFTTYLSRSTDGGETWSTQNISIVPGCIQAPAITLAPDHSLLLACLNKPYISAPPPGTIEFKRSTDWGRTFSPSVRVADLRTYGTNGNLELWGGFRTNGYPRMAVNPVNGDIYVVYNDWSHVSTDWADVYLKVSHDKGATWSPPIRVDSDTGISDQYMPTVAVTSDGTKVMVAFYDRRVDDWTIRRMAVIGDASGLNPVFGRDFPLSPPFPPVVGQDTLVNRTYMGHYDGIAADRDFFYTTWTDSRDPHLSHANQPDIRFAKIPKDLYAHSANLLIALAATPDPVPVVGAMTTTLVVTNAGPEPAAYVETLAGLPADVTITSLSTDRGVCMATDAQKVECTLGVLAVGERATVLIGADAGVTPGPFAVTAGVGSPTPDPSSANNTASATIGVVGRPGMERTTYSSGPMSENISDHLTREFRVDVPDNAGILDVDLTLHTTQHYGHELEVTLISPAGTEVPVVVWPGSLVWKADPPDCTGASTTLDDQATLPLVLAREPYQGAFRPVEPLAALRGGPTAGTWRIRVTQLYTMNTATLHCWSLGILKDTRNVPPPAPPLPDAPGGSYHALPPSRILDTRNGTGGFSGPIGAGAQITPTVVGVGGVPAAGASAVVLNVTATQPTAESFLTVFPSGTMRPLASNLNYPANRTVPNLVVAKVGADGKVAVYNHSGSTHVVIDVVGWFEVDGGAGGASYTALAPSRIVDTRDGTGGFTGWVGPGGLITPTVTGVGGVPSTGVTAVVLNVTVTQPTAESFLTVFPSGVARPLASNLNFLADQTVPNLVVAKVGVDGKVAIYNHTGSVLVVVDVVGWFGPDVGTGSGRYNSLSPSRILDTRTSTGGLPGPVQMFGTITPTVAGVGGVPATGAAAVVLNITVTEPTAVSYLTVYPTGAFEPLASSLNWVRGQTVPNLVVAKVGFDGKVALYNYMGNVHVVIDVVGWFAA